MRLNTILGLFFTLLVAVSAEATARVPFVSQDRAADIFETLKGQNDVVYGEILAIAAMGHGSNEEEEVKAAEAITGSVGVFINDAQVIRGAAGSYALMQCAADRREAAEFLKLTLDLDRSQMNYALNTVNQALGNLRQPAWLSELQKLRDAMRAVLDSVKSLSANVG